MGYNTSSALDLPLATDQTADFRGGMDGYERAAALAPNQCAVLENVMVLDDGRLKTRFGTLLIGADLGAGAVQGLGWLNTPAPINQIVAMCDGALSYSTGGSWTSPSMGTWAPAATLRPEMVQGMDKLYISDGVNAWRTWDGSAIVALGTGTGPLGDPPVGATILCWHTNRMFASGISARPDEIDASLIMEAGSHPGDGKWDYTKFSFRAGWGEGDPVTGLASLRGAWLGVAKRNSMLVYVTDPTATAATGWQLLYRCPNVGCVGKRAHTVHGDHWWFLSDDGIRRISIAEGNSEQLAVSAPMSEPMQTYIDRMNKAYAYLSCAKSYRRWLLFSIPIDSATKPNCTLVYDSVIGRWIGAWTATSPQWTPTCWLTYVASEQPRLAFGDSVGVVQLWQDYQSMDLAATFQDNAVKVPALVRSRSFVFGADDSAKSGDYARLDFLDAQGTAQILVYYDGVLSKRETVSLTEVQNQLPVNLPFNLAVSIPQTAYVGLDALGEFMEGAIEVQSSDPLSLRRIQLGAYQMEIRRWKKL